MCGRFLITAPQEQMARFFSITGQSTALLATPPRYNIAPTQPVLTILGTGANRHAQLMKWAFLPGWVKDPKDFSIINNARCETIGEKPSFKNAIKQRRCIIPASGFYEWSRKGSIKQPYWIRPKDEPIMALAAIWETWMGPHGEEVDTTAILTIASNQSMAKIHHRMPVIIPQNALDQWLDCRSGRLDDAGPLMRQAPEDYLLMDPISDRVNRVANDDPSLLEPIALSNISGKPANGSNLDKSEHQGGGEQSKEQKSQHAKTSPNKDQLSLF